MCSLSTLFFKIPAISLLLKDINVARQTGSIIGVFINKFKTCTACSGVINSSSSYNSVSSKSSILSIIVSCIFSSSVLGIVVFKQIFLEIFLLFIKYVNIPEIWALWCSTEE